MSPTGSCIKFPAFPGKGKQRGNGGGKRSNIEMLRIFFWKAYSTFSNFPELEKYIFLCAYVCILGNCYINRALFPVCLKKLSKNIQGNLFLILGSYIIFILFLHVRRISNICVYIYATLNVNLYVVIQTQIYINIWENVTCQLEDIISFHLFIAFTTWPLLYLSCSLPPGSAYAKLRPFSSSTDTECAVCW